MMTKSALQEQYCVLSGPTVDLKAANSIASAFGLELIEDTHALTTYSYAIECAPIGVGLKALNENLLPVTVDWVSGKAAHRRQFGGGVGQMIAKAVGLKDRRDLNVVDATAGLGGDAFVLASLGARVELLERHPIIALLLSDGINRAASSPEVLPIVQRMRPKFGSAHQWLKDITQASSADVVYLDPMFPESAKKAQVKREMQVFRQCVGPDEDADALLPLALQAAKYRVVVKRPRLAPFLSGLSPSYQLEGKANRFDVYVNCSLKKT